MTNIIITDTAVDINIRVTLNVTRNDTIAPRGLPTDLGGNEERNAFFTNLRNSQSSFIETLKEKIAARLGQLKKGENIDYNTLQNWVDSDLGRCYQRKTMQLRAESADGRVQNAATGESIHVRSVEVPKAIVNITFE